MTYLTHINYIILNLWFRMRLCNQTMSAFV